MDDKELLKLTPGELVDLGICLTCFNRKHNGALYGDNKDKLIYEDETNLFLVSSRYYSPELCRWISPDDIEYLDPESVNGLNLYCYCLNNPIMYKDSTGHFPVAIDAMTTFFEGSIELYSVILKYSLKAMEKAPEISMKVAKKMARKGGHLQSARQIINKPKSLINSTKNTIDYLANFSKKTGKVLLVADIAWSFGENILSGEESWFTDTLIDAGVSLSIYGLSLLPGGFFISLAAIVVTTIWDDEIEKIKDDFYEGWNNFWSFELI